MPRDSIPSSLVTRIRGASSSRRAPRPTRLQRPLGRPACPRPARRAPVHVRAAPPAPARGSCPGCRPRLVPGPPVARSRARPRARGSRRLGAAAPSAAGRAAPRTSSTSSSTPGTGSRAGGPPGPRALATRCVARSATVPPSRDRATQWKKNAESTAAIGMPKIAPAMPAILEPMTTDAEDDDRVDADRARHQARRQDVHRHEPADPHQDRAPAARPSGLSSSATATGGSPRQERPEERDHLEQAGGDGRERGVLQPEHDVDDAP